ncbi:DNA-binding protein [Mycobacterium yunnanensis]|uniref:DNA-binding protein n=1 Tax=Mycobacterium yunnanensis TaxID=368477 RepID=A0A9X2YYS4_9MYCO|nr:helix-turn-helix domain-containing protein [Mycobacterium yunnanensis]MCV7419312.1 DNA-binding protein [Mycobacterium yunnanensis]
MTRTYSVSEVAEQIGAPSERWLVEQLRAGHFPGRKVARTWRMTEQDVTDALDACLNNPRITRTAAVGLTATSRKRVSA